MESKEKAEMALAVSEPGERERRKTRAGESIFQSDTDKRGELRSMNAKKAIFMITLMEFPRGKFTLGCK